MFGSLIKTVAVTLVGVATLLPAARAQDYPSRNIRLISPSAAGGPTDMIARVIGERLGTVLKTNVLVENKPGAVGAITLSEIAKAAPDGYTMGIAFVAGSVIHPLMNDKLQFNVHRDFTYIVRATSGGNVVVVNASLPVRNIQELIAYAKAQPQPPNYGSWGNGSHGHITMEYIRMQTGMNVAHVPYKSTTALATDMAGGHMQIGVLDAMQTMTHVRSGKLRALAIAGPRRISTMPDVATLSEQGVNLTKGPWTGIIGPANMPKAIVDRLSGEVQKILNEPEVREKFVAAFGEPPLPGSSEEFRQNFESDWEIWGKVIRDANIKM